MRWVILQQSQKQGHQATKAISQRRARPQSQYHKGKARPQRQYHKDKIRLQKHSTKARQQKLKRQKQGDKNKATQIKLHIGIHYLMGIGPNTKKAPRIAESRFGYLKVCSSIVQCQKNPKKQAIGEKSQNLFFQGEFTT